MPANPFAPRHCHAIAMHDLLLMVVFQKSLARHLYCWGMFAESQVCLSSKRTAVAGTTDVRYLTFIEAVIFPRVFSFECGHNLK